MLILASQSPRRREILTAAGIPFVVRAAGVEEQHRPSEAPVEYARRLAREKAMAVERDEADIVLGADTVVVAGGTILEKPQSRADAARMLRMLSGREHTVVTGIALVHGAGVIEDSAATAVRFADMTDDEIAAYADSGEPDDKAGAYAIQGLASKFIERIDGDYFNVVGLPVALVYRHLQRIGQMSTAG